jgi:hypothetical protein
LPIFLFIANCKLYWLCDENNEPVWRYVDKRNWWVYGVNDDWNWIKLGEAK